MSGLEGYALVGAAGILASKDLLVKLLGPTAEYLGQETKHFAEKACRNLNDILGRAIRKLGKRIEQPGQVSPRVLKGVWEQGAFCDDRIAAEYLAGVLASSRVEIARDDRGVAILDVIRGLSAYQLRLHYVIYRIAKQLGQMDTTKHDPDRYAESLLVYIPMAVYSRSMEFGSDEDARLLLDHSAAGLVRHSLVSPHDYAWGPLKVIRRTYFPAKAPGLVVRPSEFGCELFLWAHGHPNVRPPEMFKGDVALKEPLEVSIPDGAEVASRFIMK